MTPLRTALLLAALWAATCAAGLFEPLERLTAQARYLTRPAQAFRAPVTLVAIDERALKAEGQMPWDRRTFARLLDRLHDQGAKVVGIDVAFNEPAHDPAEDQALAAAIARTPTVLPTFLAYADASQTALEAIEPLPLLKERAAALGSIQLTTRFQSQTWEIEPYQEAAGRLVPAFAVAIAGLYREDPWRPAPRDWLWRNEPLLIDFRAPAGGAPAVSAEAVLASELAPRALAGRIVLVGATATGLPDTNFAPPDVRGGPISGVEITANVLDNLLAGHFLRRLSPLALALLLVLAALGPGRLLCTGNLTGARRVRWLLLGMAAWAGLAIALFQASIWLELVPMLGFLLSCHAWGVYAERTTLLTSRNQLLARYASDLAGESQRQRARIDGELHDGLQQLLYVVAREARLAQRDAAETPVGERLSFLGQLADQAQDEVIRLRAGLIPPALREGGLADALPTLAHETTQRAGLAVDVAVETWKALPADMEVELYWLVKEALNNAEKHAAATAVRIRLTQAAGLAAIEVRDDGRGFEPPDPSVAPVGTSHSGLHRLWLRMRGNGGDMTVHSQPGEGTCLRFTLPLAFERSLP